KAVNIYNRMISWQHSHYGIWILHLQVTGCHRYTGCRISSYGFADDVFCRDLGELSSHQVNISAICHYQDTIVREERSNTVVRLTKQTASAKKCQNLLG